MDKSCNFSILYRKAAIVLLWMMGFIPSIYAQSGIMSGSVTDVKQRPLIGVTLKISLSDDSLYKFSTVSDANGRYSFNGLKPGNYAMKATFVGFEGIMTEATIIQEKQTLRLAPLRMMPNNRQLQEVVISAAPKVITMSKGKLIYNVEQSPAAAGSTALELLRSTPGISIDQDQNLLLKGSAAVNVMIDGKMTYLSAQQLSNMLSGMMADNISKIEVITAPSAQYDAAGNAGIINIMTRKSNKPGYAANLNAGTTIGRYLLNAESITGNIKTNKFNFFGNAGYSYRHSYSEETSTQVTTGSNGLPLIYDRIGNNPHQSYYYSYKAGIDIYLNAKNQLGFVYTGSTDDWSKDAGSTTYLRTATGQISSYLQSHTLSKEPYYNNVYNVNYKFNIDTTGKVLTADADYIAYRNNSDGFLSSNSYTPSGNALEPYQQLNFHQPSYIDIRSVKSDLVYPVQRYTLKAGAKYSSVAINNNFRYDSLVNNNYRYAPSLSDHFVYKEQIAAAYFSAARAFKTTYLEVGLRLEHTYTDANSINTGIQNERNYTDLFPSVSITQQLNKNNKLDVSLSRRINRPNYGNLNPVRYYSDKYALYQGNPNLIAEKAWITALSYTFLDKYIASISYNRANNFIGRSAVVDAATGILISSNVNYPHKDRLEAQVIIPVQLTSFWEVNTNATLSYTAYPLAQLSGYSNVSKVTIDLFADQTFRLPGSMLFELMTRYTSPDLNGVYMARYYFSMDGGIKKSFFQKKLDARFAFADLFHTAWYWGYSISNTTNYTYKNTPDSRRFSISLSYHLGGKLSIGKQHRIDEQDRL